MGVEDKVLVSATLDGRKEAFDELVRKYVPAVYGVCYHRIGRRPDADDLVQEVFMKAFKALPSLREREKFGSWLYGLATRVCLDWLRLKQRRSSPESFDEEKHTPSSNALHRTVQGPASDSEIEVKQERMMRMVDELPDIYREVLIQFYFEERSYEEMAQFLGLSRAAVNARLTRARAMLRERLNKVVLEG